MARLEQEFRDYTPIEAQHYDVMFHVHEADAGIRPTDLADAVMFSKSGLTSLVDRMEAADLVERRPDPGDRRAIRIHLTGEGREKFEAASLHHRSVVRRLFTTQLSADEAEVMTEVLTRVCRGVRELEDPL
jgi:DNA-binding MarR family transcriptional regulator